jgi:hypothetical protein
LAGHDDQGQQSHNVSTDHDHAHHHDHDHDHDDDHDKDHDHVKVDVKNYSASVPAENSQVNRSDSSPGDQVEISNSVSADPATSSSPKSADLLHKPDESILVNFEAVPTVLSEVFFDDDEKTPSN